jgi:cytochrome c oxidase subunit 2
MMDVLHGAGPQAAHVVDLWRVTLAVCGVVFTLVLCAFLLALWRGGREQARQLEGDERPGGSERAERRAAGLVVASVVVSVALLFVLITLSVLTDRALARADLRDAIHIEVTAHQWWWELRYDDPDVSRIFTTANEMHVPVGRPIILTLRSDDVIHSFWLPSIVGKKDLIPGRPTTHFLRADVEGRYRGQCAEFCGAQHAWMVLELVAQQGDAFERWAQGQRAALVSSPDAKVNRGRELFLSGSCTMCHAVSGTEASGRRGPDLTHVGNRRRIAAGALPNTPEAMAQWISDPQQVKPGVNMPANRYSQDDLLALVAFLGSLQ